MNAEDETFRTAQYFSAATLHEAAAAEFIAEGRITDPAGQHAPPRTALDPAIRAAWPSARIIGPAFTVQGAGGDNLALHAAVAAAPRGAVLVADFNGAQYGHWGEVLAVAAQLRGLAGLLIDGAVRDVVEQKHLEFPVFSRGVAIAGTRKLFPGKLGTPVEVGGVVVHPGDLVVGDDDGVVVIARGRISRVVEQARQRTRHEEKIMASLLHGETTIDLYGLEMRPTV